MACLSLTSCSGVQSALDPAGEEADRVATLFWVMTTGGLLIWAVMVVLSLYASRWKKNPTSEENAGRFIFWGGVVFPVTVLTALLTYALWLMPSLRPFAGGEQASLRIEVVGHQFWWHVVYHRPDGKTVVSANEIRLPVGKRVEFELKSADMIHSFWIPALGGKMDLIPGRTNRLSLSATKAGTYRGQCAEFCGMSHAWMAFPAVVMEQTEFDNWLDARGTASAGQTMNSEGKTLFDAAGCGECHNVDASVVSTSKGPDLSHVGSRLTIGAGFLPNEVDTLVRFITDPASVKPGAQMPPSTELSAEEINQIAIWLKGLQ